MGHRFLELAATPAVKAAQTDNGSRQAYAQLEGGEPDHHRLGDPEAIFLARRDTVYMASVSETGWPYVQHRGGPSGFLKVLDASTLGYADFSGNRQYITVGNLKQDDRISIILVNHAQQIRLKLIGRARTVDMAHDPDLIERLRMPGYGARIERACLIDIAGYDWNCPQHITPRYTLAEIARMTKA